MSFKYRRASDFGDLAAAIIVRTPELRNSKATYVNSGKAILALLSAPVFNAAIASSWEIAGLKAKQELTGEVFPSPDQIKEVFEDVEQLTVQKLNEFTREEVRFRIESGWHNMEFYLKASGDAAKQWVPAMFNSVIILAWTAFEVMAGDLWEGALNAHPARLARLEGKPKAWNLDDSQVGQLTDQKTRKQKQADDKVVRLWFLQRYQYDLSRLMGKVLKDRFKFNKLTGIREAYAKAFSKDYKKIRDLLTAQCLDDLSAARNLIVHRSGIVDKDFKRQTGKSELFSSLKTGDSLVWDGDMVRSILKPVFQNSLELIAAVDQWIIDHDEKLECPSEDLDG